MVMNEDEEHAAAAMIRQHAEQRAVQALERADEAIAAPRPWAGAGDEWAQGIPLAEPVTTKRAPAAASVNKVRMQTAPSPPSDASRPVRTDVFELVLRKLIDGERRHARELQAPLLERLTDLEARLAKAEGRVAELENRKGKK